jgi:hypothetical protein
MAPPRLRSYRRPPGNEKPPPGSAGKGFVSEVRVFTTEDTEITEKRFRFLI